MAELFNPKEDIIKIELTSYGTRKLAEGKLSPMYYSFHDDEVYYGDDSVDSIYKKLKKDDHKRIYKDSAYITGFKKKYNTKITEIPIEDSQDTISITEGIINMSEDDYGKNVEDFYNTTQPIGTSNINSSLSPTIRVTSHGEGTSISTSAISNDDGIINIDLGNIDYIMSVKNLSEPSFGDDEELLYEAIGEYSTDIFEDDTFITIDVPEVLFSFEETNANSDFDNFEIEMYEYDEDGLNYVPLVQPPKYQENVIEDGILVDGDNEEEVVRFALINSDKRILDTYFTIEVDDEIPEGVIKESINKDNPVDVYASTLSGQYGDDC